MLHTPECQKRQEQALVDRINYFKKWPNACQACNVVGGSLTADTFWDDETYFSCEACRDGCPRCRVHIIDNLAHVEFVFKELPCPSCGYAWGKMPTDLPPGIEWECDCEEI